MSSAVGRAANHLAANSAGSMPALSSLGTRLTFLAITWVCLLALTLTVVFKLYDPVILAAALLHDVIEDTTGDFDDIANLCGAEVACIVASLTKDTRIPEKKREEVYKKQIENSDWRTKIIKLADIYDNLCDAQESGVKVNVFSDAEFMLNSCRNDQNLSLAVKELELLIDYLKALH